MRGRAEWRSQTVPLSHVVEAILLLWVAVSESEVGYSLLSGFSGVSGRLRTGSETFARV